MVLVAALAFGSLTMPCQAAPGAFELSASAACFSYSPAVFISWTQSSGATRYQPYRDGQPYTLKKDFGVLYDDDVAVGGPAHSYVVRASDSGGITTDSNTVTIAPTSQCAPAPPPAFTISGKPFCAAGDASHSPTGGVYLSWDRVRYASHFDVYRDGGFVLRLQAYSNQLLYDYEAVPLTGGPFTYSVVAGNSLGTSASNSVALTVPADVCITDPPPFPPGPFTLTANAFCNGLAPAVHLQWTSASKAVSYAVIRNGVNVIGTLPEPAHSFDDTAALSNGSYSYYIRATSPGGMAASNTVGVGIDASACSERLPDLAAVDVTPSPMSARAGQQVSVSLSVQNLGEVSAPATKARVRFGKGTAMSASDALLATIDLPSLAAGSSAQRTVTVTLPSVAAGTYKLFLSLDEERSSGDTQWANNVKASAAFTLGDMISPKRRAATH